MQQDGHAFTEEDLIAEVISKNIPLAWVKDFKLAKLHLKNRVRDVMTDLVVIEEQVKTHQKPPENANKKQLKNPCRIHGGHEWEDCRQNPINQKEDGKTKHNENNHSRQQNESSGRPCNENRCTKRDGENAHRERTRTRSNSRTRSASKSTSSGSEYLCINNKNDYLGLVDSGSSGSLVNKELVRIANFKITKHKKPTK
jgi:hypothetical protein